METRMTIIPLHNITKKNISIFIQITESYGGVMI